MMLARNRSADAQGGKILGAGFANEGAGGHEIVKSRGDVLIGDADLFFERVQLGIVEDFPPFAVQRRVLRLSDLPAVHVLRVGGGDFFVGGRSCGGRPVVARADIAGLQQ